MANTWAAPPPGAGTIIKQQRFFSRLFLLTICLCLMQFSTTQAAVVEAYKATVQNVYIAYYGRPADPVGLDYWTNRLDDANGNLDEIIESFANSAETQSLYGGLDDRTKVNTIYQQLFARDSDDAGLDYYAARLANGQSTHANIMLDILNGAINDDAAIASNKLRAALEFTDGLDTPEKIASYNADTLEETREWLAGITADSDTGTNTGGEGSGTTLATNQSARFLTQATFGPTSAEISALSNSTPSQWFRQQLGQSPSLLSPVVAEYATQPAFSALKIDSTTFGFWRNAITGQDQLRQRMAFALSELLVVSNGGGEVLTDVPEAVAYYEDLLINNAFGNYRDILEQVTYSPAMGYYLTYEGNLPADPETGRMPDENYARELLQLFTIGVVELNNDGTAKSGSNGQIETYNNTDITGLAKVFTGLELDGDIDDDISEEQEAELYGRAYSRPMRIVAEQHSTQEKTFLGLTIPANTPAKTSITLALDHIFNHPNVGPFIGRQIIQRLVSSNPSPAYINRVATAFNQGTYQLPDGSTVGQARRGDLTATLAAVLFDSEALTQATNSGGKVREPILRFTHWARAFKVQNITPEYVFDLFNTSSVADLAQHPYQSPSVFNFFRPGYKAPGSLTAAAGLTAPELQIVNASSIPGYANFINSFINRNREFIDVDELQNDFDEEGIDLDASQALQSFIPDYSTELALADSPSALLDHLDLLLTSGTLSSSTRQWISDTLDLMPASDEEERDLRVKTAILMMMTSPDYLVQQ